MLVFANLFFGQKNKAQASQGRIAWNAFVKLAH